MDNRLRLKDIFPIFPLSGKKPRNQSSWLNTKIGDPIPEGNYGVYIRNKHLIIDIDVKGGKPGLDSFKKLCSDLKLSKDWYLSSYMVQSGTGGFHIFLTKPEDIAVRKTLSIYPGIEFLSGNAYVVGEGSIHPDTNTPYTCYANDPSIMIPAPDELLRLLEVVIEARKDEGVVCNDETNILRFVDCINQIETIHEGSRTNITYTTAAKGRDFGLSEDKCYEVMDKYFKPKTDPLIDDEQMRSTVSCAYKYAKNPQGIRSLSAIFSQEDPDEDKDIDVSTLVWHRSDKGKTQRTLNNAVNHVSLLCAGVFRYNTFSNKIEITSKCPWLKKRNFSSPDINDEDYALLSYLISRAVAMDYGRGIIYDAIMVVAKNKRYHPVQNYLNSLTWDGVPRLDTWLRDYAGVKDNEYTRAVSRKVLCGAVKRIFEPGCKFDYVTVLEGAQGIGKSTLIRILGKMWHGEMKFETSKDMIHNMKNKWVIELTEMAGLRHAEMKAIKAFTTISTDTVRLSYGKESMDIPRSSIFIGTINPNGGYLSDIENRRFWMVECGKIDMYGLDQIVDQLWAEARMFYKDEKLFLDGEALNIHITESILRRPEESLMQPVMRWMDNNKHIDEITASDILEAEGMKKGTYLTSELNRVGIILIGMGWEKAHITKGITPMVIYRRPKDEILKRQIEDI